MQARPILLVLSLAIGVEAAGAIVAHAQSRPPPPPPPQRVVAPPPPFSPTNLRCDPNVGIVANATTSPDAADKCWQAVPGQTGEYQLTNASQTCRTEALPASASLASPKTLSMDGNGTLTLDGALLKPKCVLDAQGTADVQSLATKVKGAAADLNNYLASGLVAASSGPPTLISAIPQTAPIDSAASAVAPCSWPDPKGNANDKKRIGSAAYVGIDLTGATPTVSISPERNVILPNQSIIVGVCQRAAGAKKLQITVGGTRGFASPSVNGENQALVPGAAVKTTMTELPFAPRERSCRKGGSGNEGEGRASESGEASPKIIFSRYSSVHAVTAVQGGDLAAQDRPEFAEAPGQSLAAAADAPEVEVHITSNKPGTFFGTADALEGRPMLTHPDLVWEAEGYAYPNAICRAPCSARVPIGDNPYRLATKFEVASRRFDLFPSTRGLDIPCALWLPCWLLPRRRLHARGATFTLTGATMLATWAALGEPTAAANNAQGTLRPVGTAVILIGLPSLAIGLPLFLTQRTKVDVVERSGAKEAGRPLVRWSGQGFSF
jgi:hypothetical protein